MMKWLINLLRGFIHSYISREKNIIIRASYLPGIGDESSPAIALYKSFIDKKFNVEIIDEYLDFLFY